MGICKKKKTSTKKELKKNYGETWIWTALDTTTRLLFCNFIGDRTLEDARIFLKDMVNRIAGNPVFTSDELPHYADGLLELFHRIVVPEHTGFPGRPREPYKSILPEIDYATVHKIRENGRVKQVKQRVVYGKMKRILDRLKDTPSHQINTSFVERSNTNWRLWDAHLSRKSLLYAKSMEWLKAKFAIVVAVYNFVRPHESLSRDKVTRKFIPKTPAMAAGIFNRPLTISDLLWRPIYCQ